ncbi:MAG: hypothetical protein MHM6MM_008507 [Cercozoa sp. M6MM]
MKKKGLSINALLSSFWRHSTSSSSQGTLSGKQLSFGSGTRADSMRTNEPMAMVDDGEDDEVDDGEFDGEILLLTSLTLSTAYRGASGGHLPFADKCGIWGTQRYLSVRGHDGHRTSRRDDIESLAYTLLFFVLKSDLPWSGLRARSKNEKMRTIQRLKLELINASAAYSDITFSQPLQQHMPGKCAIDVFGDAKRCALLEKVLRLLCYANSM